MLLFVLICCVDFIIGFRDDFSTIFQSCVFVVMRDGVTVRNPKMDLKLESGCPRYGLKNRRRTREKSGACVATRLGRVGGRGPHGQGSPLLPCVPHAPHREVTWHALIHSKNLSLSPPFKLISFPPHLLKKLMNTSRNSAVFFYIFVFLF